MKDYEQKVGPPKKPSLMLLQCRDKSHISLCEGTAMCNLEKKGYLDPGCGFHKCQEYTYPSFGVWGEYIYLSWTAHLPLRPTEWPITAALLRTRLPELRNNAGRFICPPLAAGPGMDLPELCCFDPNSCGCVNFEDTQDVLRFSNGETPAKRLFPLQLRGSRVEPPEECEVHARAHRMHHLSGTPMYGPGQFQFRAQPCHSGSQCLVFRYTRSIHIPEIGISCNWYQALDPDSYKLCADRDGFGIYWCRQQRCRNYYKRTPGFTRIVYGADFSIRCPRSCE